MFTELGPARAKALVEQLDAIIDAADLAIREGGVLDVPNESAPPDLNAREQPRCGDRTFAARDQGGATSEPAVALFMLRQISPELTGLVGELAGYLATSPDFAVDDRLPEGPIDDAIAKAGMKAVHVYLDAHESELEEALEDGPSTAGFHASASFDEVVRYFEEDGIRVVFLSAIRERADLNGAARAN